MLIYNAVSIFYVIGEVLSIFYTDYILMNDLSSGLLYNQDCLPTETVLYYIVCLITYHTFCCNSQKPCVSDIIYLIVLSHFLTLYMLLF